MTAKKKRKKGTLRRDRTPFEWTVFAISIIAIAAVIVGLLISSFTGASGPANVEASIDQPAAKAFTVTASNRGGTTAEEVVIKVERGSESHEVIFKAVPKGDEEETVVSLPGSGEAKATVVSYKEP